MLESWLLPDSFKCGLLSGQEGEYGLYKNKQGKIMSLGCFVKSSNTLEADALYRCVDLYAILPEYLQAL